MEQVVGDVLPAESLLKLWRAAPVEADPQNNLCSFQFGFLGDFSEEVIVIEHKAHPLSFDRRTANALAEGGYQVVQSLVQHVCQNGSFQVAPQSLDQVQVGAVGGQPVDLDLVPVRLEERKNRLGRVEPAVVAHHPHLLARVFLDHDQKERQEHRPAFAVGYGIGQLPGHVVDRPVDDLLLILAGGDLGLVAHRRPGACQGRMPMNLDLVLEHQTSSGASLRAFFSSRGARSWPGRARPRPVCPPSCAWVVGPRAPPEDYDELYANLFSFMELSICLECAS